MKKQGKKNLIAQAKSLTESEDLAEELSELIVSQRGDLGFLLRTLRKRPRTFNPYVLKGMTVFREPSAVDRKTAELVAVGAATALACEHCLEAHMKRAMESGATVEEILDVLLIASSIAESSVLSVALRKFRQLEGNLSRRSRS